MRILFVSTDADIGGAEVLLETLAAHRRDGDEVSLVVLLGRGSLSPRLESAMDSVDYLDFDAGSRDLRGMVRKLEKVIADRSPNIVSSHMFHADLVTALARAQGAAKVTTIHTQRFGQGVHPLTRLIARTVGLLSRRFDAVVATSPGAVDFARRYRYAHQPTLVTNTVGLPASASFRRTSRALLSLARFHPVKAHDVLFEAFVRVAEQHPEWSLICGGPAVVPTNAQLLRVVEAAGALPLLEAGRLQLIGQVDHLPTVMERSSALVISSRYGESAPIVGVEAIAHGVPVLTTDLGISARYTEPRFVAVPGSVESLATVMGLYCSLTDDDRAGVSRDARSRCEAEFSVQSALTKLDTVYHAALAHHSRRRHVARLRKTRES